MSMVGHEANFPFAFLAANKLRISKPEIKVSVVVLKRSHTALENNLTSDVNPPPPRSHSTTHSDPSWILWNVALRIVGLCTGIKRHSDPLHGSQWVARLHHILGKSSDGVYEFSTSVRGESDGTHSSLCLLQGLPFFRHFFYMDGQALCVARW